MSPAAKKPEESENSEIIGLHNLKPAPGSRRPRKRVGRGQAPATARPPAAATRAPARARAPRTARGFEGGQMPIHMRMRKLRGPHMKKSMPFEPFRTHTQPVNLGDLETRFDAGAEVTVELLAKANLAKRKGIPVKILAKGEIYQAADRPAPTPSAARPARRSRPPAAPASSSSPSPRDGSRMVATILSAFTVAEIRKKLLFTAALLAIYRLGAHIPVPGVEHRRRQRRPGAVRRRRHPRLPEHCSPAAACRGSRVFALGIMPYITASIILQLLTVVVPSLEKLSEGGRGRPGSRSRSTRATSPSAWPSPSRSATSSSSARSSRRPARRHRQLQRRQRSS